VRRKTEGVEEALARVRAALGPALARGARLEDKGRALALHVRGLGAEDAVAAVTEFVRVVEEEQRHGAPLECLHGKAVVEARPPDAKKHFAIAELLDAIGGAALAFAGDDTTDEEVFQAYPQSLTVAVMERPAVTHARTRLSSPAEVAAMIERFTDLRGAARPR
jgi:trehalose 6-phosphate phosphatase